MLACRDQHNNICLFCFTKYSPFPHLCFLPIVLMWWVSLRWYLEWCLSRYDCVHCISLLLAFNDSDWALDRNCNTPLHCTSSTTCLMSSSTFPLFYSTPYCCQWFSKGTKLLILGSCYMLIYPSVWWQNDPPCLYKDQLIYFFTQSCSDDVAI